MKCTSTCTIFRDKRASSSEEQLYCLVHGSVTNARHPDPNNPLDQPPDRDECPYTADFLINALRYGELSLGELADYLKVTTRSIELKTQERWKTSPNAGCAPRLRTTNKRIGMEATPQIKEVQIGSRTLVFATSPL